MSEGLRLRAPADEPHQALARDLVARYFEMWNTGRGAEADALLAPAYLDHAQPDVLGPAATRAIVPRFHRKYPETQFQGEVLAASRDFVAVRRTMRAVRGGEPVVLQAVALFRLDGGKLAEQWSWGEPLTSKSAPRPPREVWEQARRSIHEHDTEGFGEVFTALVRDYVDPPAIERLRVAGT
jgi:predicted SnoaL-like aldol condensation-catalyzing enzyme